MLFFNSQSSKIEIERKSACYVKTPMCFCVWILSKETMWYVDVQVKRLWGKIIVLFTLLCVSCMWPINWGKLSGILSGSPHMHGLNLLKAECVSERDMGGWHYCCTWESVGPSEHNEQKRMCIVQAWEENWRWRDKSFRRRYLYQSLGYWEFWKSDWGVEV